jgi:acyl transferase domain-containing protein/NADP-dependent 3-hydroxy acid dehydrogenase YdfG
MTLERVETLNSSDLSHPVPVAVIGMGCMFPRAEELARYWANIRKGIDAITDVPDSHWRVADYFSEDPKAADRTYAHRGGFLTPVDFPLLEFGIAPNSVEATDTTQLLGLLAARAALADSGYLANEALDRDRVSVILGVTGTLELVIPLGARLGHPIWRRALRSAGVDHATTEDVVQRIADSYVGWQENSFPGLLGNVAAGRIANRLDLRGTNCVVDAACASSLAAVSLATLELASGRCDLAVTGGLDTFNDIFMYMCFSKTPALSPTGEARPFDSEADGTILGEGLGLFVLKRLDDARRDGDRIYAVIRSIGTSSDGKGQAVYAPSAGGQVKALERAYASADISPGTVELVEAHGTGTRIGDATELAALEEVYQKARSGPAWCALGSVKSQVGHTKAAAGAAGLIKAALALHHKVLPPTLKVERPIERLGLEDSPFYLSDVARPWLRNPEHPRRAAVSAFGFGGSNFHCVLEEAEAAQSAVDWDGDVQIIAFSGDAEAEIEVSLKTIDELSDWRDVRSEASTSRARFRTDHHCRLVLVVERDKCDLKVLCAQARARLESLSASGSVPEVLARERQPRSGAERVFIGVGPTAGSLAMLFPGQGSQYPNMLRELACLFPRMQAALDLANQACGAQGARLSDRIYPPTSFSEATRREQERFLRDTGFAQPAIGAVSLGLLRILEEFGVHPDLTGGHSFGELTAVCAAGRIDDRALAFLSQRRGTLMASCAEDAPGGAMLAVFAPAADVAAMLRVRGVDVVVANINAPWQCVVSGPSAEIERSKRWFDDRGFATGHIPVSAAFHSRAVAGAAAPLREALDSIELVASKIPVFANTTAAPYPDDARAARELLAGQLARPVEFVAQIEAMYRAGARTFLEVGPDAKLTRLVHAILEGRDHHTLATDASRGASGNLCDLACALAALATLGHAIDLTRWDEGSHPSAAAEKKAGLTVKICGANARPNAASSERPVDDEEPPSTAPNDSQKLSAFPTSARLSIERQANAPSNARALLPDQTEIDRTMDSPEWIHPRHTNGQINSHPVAPPDGIEELPLAHPTNRHRELDANRADALFAALSRSQENLVALQRLAQQTADLHRQFLEGQEKTQQTFLKLLDHEQHLALAMLDPTRPPDARANKDTEASIQLSRPSAQLHGDAKTNHKTSKEPNRDSMPVHATGHRVEPTVVERVTGADENAAAAVLIEVVSEKTGYPVDVLDLDLQLDADLGIDSIKRVEIFSALQERLTGLPSVDPDRLGSFRSLRAIVDFMVQGNPDSTAPAVKQNAIVSNPPGDRHAKIAQLLVDVVAEKTGYPTDMLELPMKLDTDLGIDSIKRVEIFSALQERLPNCRPASAEEIGALGTLGDIVAFLGGSGEMVVAAESRANGVAAMDDKAREILPTASYQSASEKPASTNNTVKHDERSVILRLLQPVVRAEENRERGDRLRLDNAETILVSADGSALSEAVCATLKKHGCPARIISLDDQSATLLDQPLAGLIVVSPNEPRETFVKSAFRVLRAAGPRLLESAAQSGAVLATVSRLDGAFGFRGIEPGIDSAGGALAGMAKTARREWPKVTCKAIDLDTAFDSPAEAAGLIVDEVLRSGPNEIGLSRRGRVAIELEAVIDPGKATGHSVRLGRGDLVVISGGARGITAAVAIALAEAFGPRMLLIGRTPSAVSVPEWLAEIDDEGELKRALAKHSNGRRTPRELDEEARRLKSAREIARNLARIESAGSSVIYRSVDVRDATAVQAAVAEAQAKYGPVRALIHGAGVLADRKIVDQTDAQFDSVYGTKVSGLHNLFRSIEPDLLSFLILFSSSTARFGRFGQVAYAAANETLNKFAQQQARRLPNCRVVSYNWGPWTGGMVQESLKPVFEKEGISLIPVEAGGKLVVDEIRRERSGPVEIVVLAEPHTAGRAVDSPPQDKAGSRATVPMMETVSRRVNDLDTLPVLASHVIDGHAVLPLALIMEWLAEGAVQRNPGLVVYGIDNLRLYKGVILDSGKSSAVEIRVGKAIRTGPHFIVPAELVGALANGREVAHARAEIVLADRYEAAARELAETDLLTYSRSPQEIYHTILFHGPSLQGIERVEGLGERQVAGWVGTSPEPSEWIDQPNRRGWLTDPLAIDSAFQLVVLWCRDRLGANSLPTAVGGYRQFRRSFPPEGVRVLAEIRSATDSRAVVDIEFLDADGMLVARLGSYECVVDASLNQAFRRNNLATEFSLSRAH